jgi:hypothetical protein
MRKLDYIALAATVLASIMLGLVVGIHYSPKQDTNLRTDMELCLDNPVYNTLELLAQCLDDVDKAH